MPGRRHRVAVFFFFFRRRRAAAAAVSLLLRAEHPGEQRRFLRPRLHLRDVETVRVVVATVVVRRALADFAVAVVAVDVHGVVVRGVVVHGVVHALFAALRLLLAFAVVNLSIKVVELEGELNLELFSVHIPISLYVSEKPSLVEGATEGSPGMLIVAEPWVRSMSGRFFATITIFGKAFQTPAVD